MGGKGCCKCKSDNTVIIIVTGLNASRAKSPLQQVFQNQQSSNEHIPPPCIVVIVGSIPENGENIQWENHKEWQNKITSTDRNQKDPLPFETITHAHTVTNTSTLKASHIIQIMFRWRINHLPTTHTASLVLLQVSMCRSTWVLLSITVCVSMCHCVCLCITVWECMFE